MPFYVCKMPPKAIVHVLESYLNTQYIFINLLPLGTMKPSTNPYIFAFELSPISCSLNPSGNSSFDSHFYSFQKNSNTQIPKFVPKNKYTRVCTCVRASLYQQWWCWSFIFRPLFCLENKHRGCSYAAICSCTRPKTEWVCIYFAYGRLMKTCWI